MNTCQTHMPNNGRNHSITEKNKTLKHLKHIVKQYDKPEQILNIIVQGSDNKILTITDYQWAACLVFTAVTLWITWITYWLSASKVNQGIALQCCYAV